MAKEKRILPVLTFDLLSIVDPGGERRVRRLTKHKTPGNSSGLAITISGGV